MNRISRMQLLKLAKKPKGQMLAGAKNQKGLQKFLDYAKDSYIKDSKELKRTIDEIARLEARRDELAAETKKMRKDISNVYEIIQVMGLHGAKEVRISDDAEVAYVRDGKLFAYDKRSDEMVPRNKYRKDMLNAEDGEGYDDMSFARDGNLDDDGGETTNDFTSDVDSMLDAKMMANDLDPFSEGGEFAMNDEEKKKDQKDLGW